MTTRVYECAACGYEQAAEQFSGRLEDLYCPRCRVIRLHFHSARADRFDAVLTEIAAVLGPTVPDCGCEGCRMEVEGYRTEMEIALELARSRQPTKELLRKPNEIA